MALQNRTVIIIDCNWYISASINRKSRRTIYKIITDPSILVVYSADLLKEYNQVIRREKFKRIIKPVQARRFIEFIKTRITEIRVHGTKNISRDNKDNYLLSLAKKAKAKYLITGDDDLLVLKTYLKTSIITMREFIIINSQSSNI